MPRSSDSGPGWAPGHVDEGDDRQAEPLGELHDPHRLAVALGVRHPEVAPDVLLGVGALLLADDDDPPAVEPGEPGDDRRVVAEQPVAVELDEVVGHRRDELERPRPVQVAGELDPRPDGVAADPPSSARRGAAVRAADRRRRSRARSPTRSASERQERERPEARQSRPRRAGAVGRRASRTGSSRAGRRELVAQLRPGHDPVDEAVLEQELGALEARRQLLGDGPGRDARAGEPDQRVRLGDVDVADAPRTRRRRRRSSGRSGPQRTGRRRRAGARAPRSVLASCIRASVPSCIRAPPEALTTMQRDPRRRARARRPG